MQDIFGWCSRFYRGQYNASALYGLLVCFCKLSFKEGCKKWLF